MRYRSADSAMAAYLRLRETAEAPPGVLRFDSVDSYDDLCRKTRCKGNKRPLPTRFYRGESGRWRCRECNRLRGYERIQVLRPGGRDRDPDALSVRDRLADLAWVFVVLKLDEQRLLEMRVRRGRAGLLGLLRELWPFGPWRAWEESETSRVLRAVRRKVEERLEDMERRGAA